VPDLIEVVHRDRHATPTDMLPIRGFPSLPSRPRRGRSRCAACGRSPRAQRFAATSLEACRTASYRDRGAGTAALDACDRTSWRPRRTVDLHELHRQRGRNPAAEACQAGTLPPAPQSGRKQGRSPAPASDVVADVAEILTPFARGRWRLLEDLICTAELPFSGAYTR